jgi:hypothetical protein
MFRRIGFAMTELMISIRGFGFDAERAAHSNPSTMARNRIAGSDRRVRNLPFRESELEDAEYSIDDRPSEISQVSRNRLRCLDAY